jgi:hypothetical protein
MSGGYSFTQQELDQIQVDVAAADWPGAYRHILSYIGNLDSVSGEPLSAKTGVDTSSWVFFQAAILINTNTGP